MRKFGKTLAAVIAVAIVGVPAAAMAADTTITVTKGGTTATTIQAGDTINVTNSSPIDVSGQLKQTLASVWSKESLQLTDTSSIVAPDGWSLEYQDTADNWSSTAPGDLSTVTGIRAVGDVQSNGDNVFVTVAKTALLSDKKTFRDHQVEMVST
jgi:ribosomal protein L13